MSAELEMIWSRLQFKVLVPAELGWRFMEEFDYAFPVVDNDDDDDDDVVCPSLADVYHNIVSGGKAGRMMFIIFYIERDDEDKLVDFLAKFCKVNGIELGLMTNGISHF